MRWLKGLHEMCGAYKKCLSIISGNCYLPKTEKEIKQKEFVSSMHKRIKNKSEL